MTKGKLYGYSANFRTQKVLVAAKYGNEDIDVVNDEPPVDKFPLGLTPAFEGENETILFGSESISFHVGGPQMKGQNQDQLPQVVQWLQWAEAQLLPNVLGYVLPCVSAMQMDKKSLDESKSGLMFQLSILNSYLLSRTFLVGQRITLADISIVFDLLPAFQYVLEPSIRSDFVNLNRWFMTVVNQVQVKQIIGEIDFCENACQFDGKKYKQLTGKIDKEHSEKERGQKKTDKQKKLKENKNKYDDQEEEDEEISSLEPKSVDPFAKMPKSSFVMDNFKRVYSNEDTIAKAIPYFWENFDHENYSIWHCEYKYPEELALIFMSCNLINGMFQRLDKLRKNAFASVVLFGENSKSTISGIWIWKGHQLVFPLSPDWQVDYDSYEWTRLDSRDGKTRKIVDQYLAWEGEFDGKIFNQAKIFK